MSAGVASTKAGPFGADLVVTFANLRELLLCVLVPF